jgi:NAD(P)-dependent dehydrogenase (short-subunit alcohol dehydrogenase family)
MKLKDRVAIVTGGAKGIGWGIVKILVQEGAKVVVADWDEVKGEETAAEMRKAGGEAIFVKTDVSQEEQVKKLVQATLDRYGMFDILVNDAGIGVQVGSGHFQRGLGPLPGCQPERPVPVLEICHPAHAGAGQGRHCQHLFRAFFPDRQWYGAVCRFKGRHHRPDPQHGD